MNIRKLFDREPSEEQFFELEIISEIRKTNAELEEAYRNFQLQTNEDLLEASIYRIKELRSRHNYLIKLARENKVEAYYMNFNHGEKIKDA